MEACKIDHLKTAPQNRKYSSEAFPDAELKNGFWGKVLKKNNKNHLKLLNIFGCQPPWKLWSSHGTGMTLVARTIITSKILDNLHHQRQPWQFEVHSTWQKKAQFFGQSLDSPVRGAPNLHLQNSLLWTVIVRTYDCFCLFFLVPSELQTVG